jgi:hypothetical protein
LDDGLVHAPELHQRAHRLGYDLGPWVESRYDLDQGRSRPRVALRQLEVTQLRPVIRLKKRTHFFLRLAALASGLGLYATAAAALSLGVDKGVVLQFEDRAIALGDAERSKIIVALEEIRTEDWCGFQFAVAVGHADPSEGPSRHLQELSNARAAYVGRLLFVYGVPPSRIGLEGKGARESLPASSRRVELHFRGEGLGGARCRYPLDPGGFRLTK